MSDFIQLVEVRYKPDRPDYQSDYVSYSFKSVWINIKEIVKFELNKDLVELNKHGKIHPDLIKDEEFSTIQLASAPGFINVISSPQVILRKIHEAKKSA